MSRADEPLRWYFAYGSNLDPRTFLGRRSMRPLAARRARLDDFRLVFDLPVGPGERAVANLSREGGQHVHGVAWQITAVGASHLDRTEGVHRGYYVREGVTLVGDDEGAFDGFTYVSVHGRPGRKPSARYLGLLLAGARHHALPEAWVRHLRSFELAVDEREPRQGARAVSLLVLDPEKVEKTIDRLAKRIGERFPDSGLLQVALRLHELATQAGERSVWIARPIVPLRIATALVIAAILGVSAYAIAQLEPPEGSVPLDEFVQVLEAGINDVVLIGAAVFFLVTLEIRIKRRRALAAIHELRSLAHIIDMHQLVKDPERLRRRGPGTNSSPRLGLTRFELGRYLDYCSELLSLTGKLAALYVQRFDDGVALAAVNEIEGLCTGLSRKIWQKIMVLETLPYAEPGPDV